MYDKHSIVNTQGKKVFMLKPDTEYSKEIRNFKS